MMNREEERFIDHIKHLVPIGELSSKLQMKLLDYAQIIDLKREHTLFKQGDRDNFSFYLLNGKIELFDDQQYCKQIIGGEEESNYALAQLQPRRFSAEAKTDITVLQVDKDILDQFLVLEERSSNEIDATKMGGDEDESIDWMTKILQSGIFSKIPVENIQQLFSLLESIDTKAGDVIIQQGDIGEYYYIISAGCCEILRKPSPSSSRNVKLAELMVGDGFGEEALISGAKRNATVKMKTDGTIMRLSKNDFINLIKKPALVSVSFSQAERMIEEGAIWLDMRYQSECKVSCIEGSINIPLNLVRLQADRLEKEKKYIACCDTGGRSAVGTFLLMDRGYNVFHLEGGLINNNAAISGQLAVSAAPPATVEEDDSDIDTTVEAAMLKANLETTKIELSEEEKKMGYTDKEEIERQAKLIETLKKESEELEKKKEIAERKVQEEAVKKERKLQLCKKQAERNIREEQKNLDTIYEKKAADMERLQKMKEETERRVQEERAHIQEEERALEKKSESGDEDLVFSLKHQLEESRRLLEERENKSRQEQEQLEDKVRADAKEMIERERRRLAEQYGNNTKELEKLQRSKVTAEAVRQAAQEEAKKIIEEFKLSYEQERAKEAEKIEQEQIKLHEEKKRVQAALKELEETKKEAEEAKQEAIKKASLFKEKQENATLFVEKEGVSQENSPAKAVLGEKESAALAQQIAEDIVEWKAQQQEKDKEKDTAAQKKSSSGMTARIKKKAEQAKEDVQKLNDSLLEEIQNQLEG